MQTCFETDFGFVTIAEKDGKITRIAFERCEDFDECSVLTMAKMQLEEYFAGERKEFDLPICLNGTEFQRKVWRYLLTIPYGETATYKDAAEYAGNAKAARAAGAAIGSNPIAVVVPCHRIVGSNGGITGYRYGVEIKRRLLELERGNI